MLGLLWSASAGFGAISQAINRALGAPPRRSVVKARLRYLLMAGAVSTLMVAYVSLTSALEFAKIDDVWSSWLGLETDTFTHIQARAASFVIVFLIYAVLYKDAPTVEMRWRAVWPGALFAAILTEVGKGLFLAYLDYVADLESVFGSLSSIMVLLIWLWQPGVIVGAEADGRASVFIPELPAATTGRLHFLADEQILHLAMSLDAFRGKLTENGHGSQDWLKTLSEEEPA